MLICMIHSLFSDVNKRGEDNVTPLHHAARYRREKAKRRDVAQNDKGSGDVSVLISFFTC